MIIYGTQYGKLTPQEEVIHNGKKVIKCLCDCGNVTFVNEHKLLTGHTKSCGCLRRNPNKFDLSGEFGICYFHNDKGFFIFDKEDYPKLKDLVWDITKKGYARSQRTIAHRLIMDCPNELVVDHINHNKLDNRKSNLRVCSNTENCWNNTLSKHNKSGYNGVSFRKDSNKWRARITYNRKIIHLGYYSDIQDAIKARREAELKYYGEYAIKEV